MAFTYCNNTEKLPSLDFEGKRLALDMLGITIYLNGKNVEIAGIVSPDDSGIVLKSSRRYEHNTPIPFSFKVSV